MHVPSSLTGVINFAAPAAAAVSAAALSAPAPASPPLSRLLLFQVDDNELPVTGIYTLQIRGGHSTVVSHLGVKYTIFPKRARRVTAPTI